jgi:hypothetical protein
VDWISAIETIENWSLRVCHLFIILAGLLPAKRVAVLVEECDQLCRILGKSIATAKAGRRQLPGDVLERGLAITDDKFSMTNSQLKGPKS